MMKLLKLYQNESDGKKKKKMKYTIQALDDNNDIVKNEMIDLTFNVFFKRSRFFLFYGSFIEYVKYCRRD